MKIFVGDKLIEEMPINFKCINISDMVSEKSITMIPYQDVNFWGCAKLLIDDLIVTICPSWRFPDYYNFRSHIYIEDGEYRIALEVFPDKISLEKRNILLQNANQEIREDGYSDYYELQDAFDSADAFYSDEESLGEIWSYRMQPTYGEIKLLAQLGKT